MSELNDAGAPGCYYDVKVVVIGDSGVGKTSLVHRYLEMEDKRRDTEEGPGADDFVTRLASSHTISLNHYSSMVRLAAGTGGDEPRLASTSVQLSIWDTPGKEAFRVSAVSGCRCAAAALFVFRPDDRQSFTSLAEWISVAKSFISSTARQVLVCHYLHCTGEEEMMVEEEEAREWASANGMDYLCCDSAEKINVLFNDVVAAKVMSGYFKTQREMSASSANKKSSGVAYDDEEAYGGVQRVAFAAQDRCVGNREEKTCCCCC